MAEYLGIITRTLRRFKNQPGWKLAPRTIAKISKPVNNLDKRVIRLVSSGVVVKVRTYRDEKGRKKRERYFAKDKSIKLPKSRTPQIPKVYTGKEGNSLNVSVNLEGQTTDEKVAYVEAAYAMRYYDAWTMQVKIPAGYAYIPGVGFVEEPEDEEEKKQVSHYITEGPFSLTVAASNRHTIRQKIEEKEKSGGLVSSVSFYKNLLKGRSK